VLFCSPAPETNLLYGVFSRGSYESYVPLYYEDNEFIYAEFSTDGRRLVSVSRDGQVKIWTVDTKEPPNGFGHHDPAYTASKQ
jgi:WD40 repeat protein